MRVDAAGQVLSESLSAIFRSAACGPDTPALALADNHHDLVAAWVRAAHEEQVCLSGQFGNLRRIRRKVYERLKTSASVSRPTPTPSPSKPWSGSTSS